MYYYAISTPCTYDVPIPRVYVYYVQILTAKRIYKSGSTDKKLKEKRLLEFSKHEYMTQNKLVNLANLIKCTSSYLIIILCITIMRG